jgi:hypothetical protein
MTPAEINAALLLALLDRAAQGRDHQGGLDHDTIDDLQTLAAAADDPDALAAALQDEGDEE